MICASEVVRAHRGTSPDPAQGLEEAEAQSSEEEPPAPRVVPIPGGERLQRQAWTRLRSATSCRFRARGRNDRQEGRTVESHHIPPSVAVQA